MYILVEIGLAIALLWGIRLMGKTETARHGNRLAAASLLTAIVLTLGHSGTLNMPIILLSLVIGSIIGLMLALRVTMLQIPQMVALLNGLGGAASMLTVFLAVAGGKGTGGMTDHMAAGLAIAVGGVTLGGSLVAAAKLHRLLTQQPIGVRANRFFAPALLLLLVLLIMAAAFTPGFGTMPVFGALAACALAFGVLFALPVGGADMPITISLLNAMSGIAASICGLVVDDALLVSAGAIVGATGLILTQVMCAAMNRSLFQVLVGASVTLASEPVAGITSEESPLPTVTPEADAGNAPGAFDPVECLLEARRVIIVPGYGMALGEAETFVRDLYEFLECRGVDVKFAIHPVAGRMPGHMTVLLADVDIPYDKMIQLEAINPEFAQTDVAIVVGACDVVNPAAITAKGTPIYGMPILHVHEARRVIVCNADTKPGYSGIENPLYARDNVALLLGNAAATLDILLKELELRSGQHKL